VAGAAPAVRARAEGLPFRDGTFAAALAVLTLHHWSDWRRGLAEMMRVARRTVALFTWDPASDGFWLVRDYLPGFLEIDRPKFPTLDALRAALGDVRVVPVPIPRDCTDGFLGAYWARPAAYLDADVRRAISSFERAESADGLARLADDLASGAWERKHGHIVTHGELDLGYRLVVAAARGKH
jgi:SAM-dependent methyltransferase